MSHLAEINYYYTRIPYSTQPKNKLQKEILDQFVRNFDNRILIGDAQRDNFMNEVRATILRAITTNPRVKAFPKEFLFYERPEYDQVYAQLHADCTAIAIYKAKKWQ